MAHNEHDANAYLAATKRRIRKLEAFDRRRGRWINFWTPVALIAAAAIGVMLAWRG